MVKLGILSTPCRVCMSKRLVLYIDKRFDGIVVKCGVCAFDDFIANPFGDIRIFLDVPKNWYLVFAG